MLGVYGRISLTGDETNEFEDRSSLLGCGIWLRSIRKVAERRIAMS